jgi:ribosomal protein L7/L12
MTTSELMLFLPLAIFVIGVLMVRARASENNQLLKLPKVETFDSLPDNVKEQVRFLAAQGQKVEAIMILKQLTNMGLKGAKDFVESMAAGRSDPSNEEYTQTVEQLKALLRNGKKIEAIELYRKASGVGLKQAKDHIEKMTKDLN